MAPDAVAPVPPSPARRRATSFSIGHIAGIDIRVHVTFFLIVALFAFATWDSGIVGGMLWLVIIFACIVVHELAHSLVARRRGAVVHEIVLLPIGGVSKLEHLPESPADEFAIAIVGPLASFGLAALGAVVALGLRVSLWPVDLATGSLLARLVWFNVLIGGFNLLPAFPMDGGRVFRSLLERHHDLEDATRIAARTGRVLAIGLVVVGFVVDPWLVFIGVFVYFGAAAEEQATIVHVRLRGVRLADVMLLAPTLIAPTMSVPDLRDLARRNAQRVFPVVGPGGYEGMVDATIAAADTEGAVGSVTALARPMATIDITSSLEEIAIPAVLQSPARAVAVTDAGRTVGLLRIEDVEHLLTDVRREAHRPRPRPTLARPTRSEQ
jgi:Zn-dependent protease